MTTANRNEARSAQMLARAHKMAARWNLTLQDEHLLRQNRLVYKVASPYGPAALKLYREVNAGGEGASVPFYRNLPDDQGLKVYKVSPLKRAMLIEWLSGPNLQDLLDQDREAEATAHLATTARKLCDVKFRNTFIYPQVIKRMDAKLTKAMAAPRNKIHNASITRARALMDHLIASAPPEQVIHGDLHYGNVILAPDGPRLFDPKGYRGDPAMDFSKALVARVPDPSMDAFRACITRRAAVFGPAVGASPERVIQWGAIVWAGRVFYGSRQHADPAEVTPHMTAFLDLAGA